MSLLKDLLLNKKIFEAKEEIDSFLDENNIEPGSLVHKIEFDKDIYSDNKQVNDFLDAHYLDGMSIDDVDKSFEVILYDKAAFIDETVKSIPLRDGVSVVIGILRPMTPDNPLLFSDKSKNIKLSSDHPYIIEVASVVSGFHAAYGKVEITKKDLISFKNNFDSGVVGVDLSIDFDHETREAAGWIKEVFLSDDGTVLMAGVRWTPKGALSLSDREFRYFSPEFNRDWVHPHTGKVHGPTLLGGALVNRPFLKMDAIVTMKDKQGDTKVDTINLSDHNAKVSGLEKQISDFKLSEQTVKNTLLGVKAENEKLSEELKSLKTDAEKAKRDAEINLLFTEQKINKAQKDAMLDGKSMVEVLQLGEKMNTAPAGTDKTVETVQLSDAEIKLCKQLDMTPEEFVKYNEEA